MGCFSVVCMALISFAATWAVENPVASDSWSEETQGRTLMIPGLGALAGFEAQPGVELFLGIPFAKPPTGSLRWQPPLPHPGWNTTRQADEFGPACMQLGGATGPAPTNISEDCLFLNIARPAKGAGPLPVMLWFHGGGMSTGATNEGMDTPQGWSYDIQKLVAATNRSVIAVSAAYRLNVFGFLGSTELQAESRDGSTGNFGLQDQELAMRWVQQHIGTFGGDRSRVTIFGESAGAFAVGAHLSNPRSKGLFSGAIMESYGNSEFEEISMGYAEQVYSRLLASIECHTLSCLRELDASTLLTEGNPAGVIWNPVVDGRYTKESPIEAFRKGQAHDVPVIIGSNHNEMSVLTRSSFAGIPYNLTDAEVDEQLGLPFSSPYKLPIPGPALTPDEIATVKRLYAPETYRNYPADLGPYNQNFWMVTLAKTDTESTGFCTMRRFLRQLAMTPNRSSAAYGYQFGYPPKYTTSEMLYSWFGPANVLDPHGAEVRYVFNAIPNTSQPTDYVVSKLMASSWGAFATTTNPSFSPHDASTIAGWEPYTVHNDAVLRIHQDTTTTMAAHLRSAACDFWDQKWDKYGHNSGNFCQWQCPCCNASAVNSSAREDLKTCVVCSPSVLSEWSE
jgi:para-nitrobenzyl esterase